MSETTLNRIVVVAFVCASFLCGGCQGNKKAALTQNLMYDQLLKPAQADFNHVPIGLCEDYPEETTTMEIIRGDMELLKRSGIKLLRISFGWDGVETAKDQYDWLFWDEYVKTAVDEYGITLIPYICYTPRWNSTGDSLNYWNHTPLDYEEFGQFIGDLVGRYKDRIKSWEIWNEPDIKFFWSGTAEEYAKLLQIGAAAVRKADPEAIVVMGGLAHRVEFTESLFRDFGASKDVDVVNIHNYFETWHPSPLEKISNYVDSIHEIIAKYGNNQSIWMAEVGYSSFRKDDGYVSEHYSAYFDYEHTPEFQAVQLVRTLTLLLATEKLAAIAWYEIKDLPATEEVIGDVNNRHLGVAYYSHEKKPAETAISFFNRLFSDKSRCVDDRITVKRSLQSQSEIHAFEMATGDVITVAWLKTNWPDRKPGSGGQVKDTREETVHIELPMALNGKAARYDELGSETAFPSVRGQNGKTLISDIDLKGGAVTIIKVAKAKLEDASSE